MSNAAALDRLMNLGGELYTRPGEPRRKFDLAHMRALLRALGNPQQRFPSVLVAGTNGKGSTAATLASILEASGYTVGLYTSPHLSRVNERIRITPATGAIATATDKSRHEALGPDWGGHRADELQDAALFEFLARVEAASAMLVAQGALPAAPSFFESMTAIAMLAFAQVPGTERAVDIAILEVGMGGRLDATNVVEPLLSIITDISLDHTEWLGPTIADIALEKAGILRHGGTMITLPQHPEANQSLGEVAMALNVRGVNAAEFLPGREVSAANRNRYELTGWPGSTGEALSVDSPLSGQHQQRNLALAIAAAIELRSNHGYKISNDELSRGIRETCWYGRLEFLLERSDRPTILLDVAHNPAGAWALRAALSQVESVGPRRLVFGCMRDKALQEMAQILFPVFDHVHLVELPSPRSASAEELLYAASLTGVQHSFHATIDDASNAAMKAGEAGSARLIVVSGSVLLVGAMRSMLL